MTRHLVFVYGTLLRGESNHGLLDEAEFLGEATTSDEYVLVDLGPYPAIVPADEAHATRITGEVYAVDDAGLVELDHLEDAPRLYQRVEASFGWNDQSGGGRAWIYVHPAVDGRPTIPSGDWRSRGTRGP